LLNARIGFELELLAPRGSSRRQLAFAIAEALAGSVRNSFHLDAEPSKAEGIDVFHHLTPAFAVSDSQDRLRCTIVDDITIVAELDADAAGEAGWYRIVCDDRRILRLVARHCDPGAPIELCLLPLAELFGARPERVGDYFRVNDDSGATIAIAAPLPGERHRPSEVVTPPIDRDHAEVLESLLAPARSLDFVAPTESAVHLHFDAEPLRQPAVLRNLVRLVLPRQELLRSMVDTNPHCRGLGEWPQGLGELVEQPEFLDHGWAHARRLLQSLNLSKYSDLNLKNLIDATPGKDTVEWRILPGTVDVEPVIAGAILFEAILDRARIDPPPRLNEFPVSPGLDAADALLAEVGL
jgi:hypothetical protein